MQLTVKWNKLGQSCWHLWSLERKNQSWLSRTERRYFNWCCDYWRYRCEFFRCRCKEWSLGSHREQRRTFVRCQVGIFGHLSLASLWLSAIWWMSSWTPRIMVKLIPDRLWIHSSTRRQRKLMQLQVSQAWQANWGGRGSWISFRTHHILWMKLNDANLCRHFKCEQKTSENIICTVNIVWKRSPSLPFISLRVCGGSTPNFEKYWGYVEISSTPKIRVISNPG